MTNETGLQFQPGEISEFERGRRAGLEEAARICDFVMLPIEPGMTRIGYAKLASSTIQQTIRSHIAKGEAI